MSKIYDENFLCMIGPRSGQRFCKLVFKHECVSRINYLLGIGVGTQRHHVEAFLAFLPIYLPRYITIERT